MKKSFEDAAKEVGFPLDKDFKENCVAYDIAKEFFLGGQKRKPFESIELGKNCDHYQNIAAEFYELGFKTFE